MRSIPPAAAAIDADGMAQRSALRRGPPDPGPAPAGATAVLAQHRALRRLLADVEAVVLTVAPASLAPFLSPRLSELELALEAHFAHEERAGLFEQVVAEAPEARAGAAALLAEHGRIRSRVGGLRLRAQRGQGGTALANAVRRLLRDLERHEARENELVLAALATVVAAQD
jgi:hemerythrin HHE cation binding domain-containing protein